MDKSKFTTNPQLDSEGFVLYGPPHYLGELTDNLREGRVNPRGWNEPGMQPITWADENPNTTSVDVKRACAEVLLRCWNRIEVR